MEDKLKPCPFCGSTKLKLERKQTKAGYTGIDALVMQEIYSIRCSVCHARGGTSGGKVIRSHIEVYRDNMPKWATTKEELQNQAIKKWNRRVENER